MAKPTKAQILKAMREYMHGLAIAGAPLGGRARAKKLSAARRRKIARKAARARWRKKNR